VRLEADRDQLWAEAIDAFRQDEPWHLAASVEVLATEAQEMRHLHSEQELTVLEYLDYCITSGKLIVYMRDLLIGPGGIDDLRKHGREAGGIARGFSRILAKAGWERLKPVGRGPDRRQPYEYQGKREEKLVHTDNSQAHKQSQ
jgi:predicted P-loop ATPase